MLSNFGKFIIIFYIHNKKLALTAKSIGIIVQIIKRIILPTAITYRQAVSDIVTLMISRHTFYHSIRNAKWLVTNKRWVCIIINNFSTSKRDVTQQIQAID